MRAALLLLLLMAAPAAAATTAEAPPSRPAGGEALFKARCALCHEGAGPGAIMLGRRLGQDRALLSHRTDLQAPYVKAIVRHGLGSMPPISRVEVTDPELDQIAAWLARNSGKGG